MRLIVLSTGRRIREVSQHLPQGMSDTYMSIGEFFTKAVVVPGKRRIDHDLRKSYLYRAMETTDFTVLGLSRDFLRFFKNADTLFKLWGELAKEAVAIENVSLADTYAEYGEHLQILQALRQRYRTLLEADGFYDEPADEAWEINTPFLEAFEAIELEVSGYLSRFERAVLSRMPQNVILRFAVTPFNQPLIAKMFEKAPAPGCYTYDFKAQSVLRHTPLPPVAHVETARFEQRIWQVHYALASLMDFEQKGLSPERMAIILPDESMAEYLRLFDETGNLNFAMGEPFTQSPLYLTLKALYAYLSDNDPSAYRKIADKLADFQTRDLLTFIKEEATERELALIDEQLHKIERLRPYLPNERDRLLHFVLQRLAPLRFDDTDGGRVTVMGVLESREATFDGVVILDFNEGTVPNVDEADFFLSSAVRQKAGLPTRKEKEALQKHYYAQILRRAKEVRIAYVQNEEQGPSRFLYELGLNEGEAVQARYEKLLFSFAPDPDPYDYENRPIPRPDTLYPNTLATLLECSLRYYFRYVLKLKNEIEEDNYNFGTHFHEAIESVLAPRPRFEDPDTYYRAVMEALLKENDPARRYLILSRWADKIAWFCKKDFPRLQNPYKVERFEQSRQLAGFTLLARYDRMDDEAVIDYKTGQPKTADEIQALFYQVIFQKTPLFYYLKTGKIEDKSVTAPDKRLAEILQGLDFTARRTDNPQACRFCDYRFMCRAES